MQRRHTLHKFLIREDINSCSSYYVPKSKRNNLLGQGRIHRCKEAVLTAMSLMSLWPPWGWGWGGAVRANDLGVRVLFSWLRMPLHVRREDGGVGRAEQGRACPVAERERRPGVGSCRVQVQEFEVEGSGEGRGGLDVG